MKSLVFFVFLVNIFEFSPNISKFYQIFQHFAEIFWALSEIFRLFTKFFGFLQFFFEFHEFFSNFYQIFRIFTKYFNIFTKYLGIRWNISRYLDGILGSRYGRAAFFCPRMMDSCTTIAANQSASSSNEYFLFLPVCWYTSVNANNRFSYSIVKAHRHTCSHHAAEKKI